MFHLVIAACLQSSPEICAPRLLPAADAIAQEDCLLNADQLAQDWFARHPRLLATEAPRCVETKDLPSLSMTEVADGVFTHIGQPQALSTANAGRIANLSFIIGDTVIVVDAGGSRAEGEALFAAIRQRSDLPISHVILTHMHPDHIYGAEVFSEAGATIVANARLADAVQARRASWRSSIPAQIGEQAFLGTQVTAVDQAISAPTTISSGGHEIELRPVATAHTDNDLTAYDRRSGVFFTGDLVFQQLTPVIDGSLVGWLDWIAAPAPDPLPNVIVPGHGPVQSEWQDALAPELIYLEALRKTVRDLIDQGAALSAAIPHSVAAMKDKSSGWNDFDDTTARNAATAFSELEWQ